MGMLKKAASGVLWLCLSGSHRHGRRFVVLTYKVYAPRAKTAAALLGTLRTDSGHAFLNIP